MRVEGSGLRVEGPGLSFQASVSRPQFPGFRVQGSGFSVRGAGFRVQGSVSRVHGPVFGRGGGRRLIRQEPLKVIPGFLSGEMGTFSTTFGDNCPHDSKNPPNIDFGRCSKGLTWSLVHIEWPQIRQLILHISNNEG